MPAKKGDKVTVSYTGKLEDGTVFDSSDEHDAPLSFELGANQVVPGFEEAVLGMEKDEEKEFTLSPDEAYGEHKVEMIKGIPKSAIPEGMAVEAGSRLLMTLQDGTNLPATVVEVSEEEIKVDLNHPLAGKTLIFRITVLDITE